MNYKLLVTIMLALAFAFSGPRFSLQIRGFKIWIGKEPRDVQKPREQKKEQPKKLP